MKLWHKVTIGLFAGIICGSIFGEKTVYIKPMGDLFINLIKMVVAPLIFFSLISGITSMTDSAALGRIGVKSCIAFISTTAFAILIGLTVALILKPGEGVLLKLSDLDVSDIKPRDFDPIALVMDIVPTNVFHAFATDNTLSIVFFSIFTGITLNSLGKQGAKLVDFCQDMAKLVFKMISFIVQLSPYGAFALTAWVIGTQGLDVLHSLVKLIIAVIVSLIFQYLVFGLLIYVFGRLSPIPFYKKSFEYQSLAFSTSSSKAALATTMRICQDKLGISTSSTSFILPLGASINMDGMAIYLGMCAVFFAQATGVDLSLPDYVMIILTSTLGSIGAAGIPCGSMVMLPMVLSSVGLPIEGVALIAGIDRILDMMRTTINITGDATITLIVDRSEGKLDEKIYYSDDNNGNS
jgi:Na+/H+-dicarboxylate symporter